MLAALSQEALAAKAKIDESTLAKWERSTSYPTPDTLLRLRRYFEGVGFPMPDLVEDHAYNAARRSEAARKAWRGRR